MGIHDRKYMSENRPGGSSPFAGSGPKTFTTKYVILCAVLYLANELMNGQLALSLCLNPLKVYEFELWRVFSAFVMLDLGTPLIYGAIELFIIYSLGNQVEARLGSRTYINLIITTSLGILLVGILVPLGVYIGYVSGILSALFLAFGLFLGKQKMTLMLMFLIPLTLSGHMLIGFTVGLLVITALLSDGQWAYSLAMLGGCFASYVFITQYQKGTSIDILGLFRKKSKTGNKRPRRKKPAAKKNIFQAQFSVVNDEDDIDDLDSYIRDKVDPILEKIATSGMSSLTAKEKKILDEAKKKMGQ